MNETKANQLMIDIETLGTQTKSIVSSIGGVIFRLNGDTTLSKKVFSESLELNEQKERGRTIDPNAFMWWLSQSLEARTKLTMVKRRSIQTALRKLNKFCKENEIENIWGNGNMFDCHIMRSLYEDFDMEYPVSFRNDLDLRTIQRTMKAVDPTYRFEWLEGTAHSALDDARSQANVAANIMKRLKE